MEIINYLFHNTFFLVMLGLVILFAGILIYFKVSDSKKESAQEEAGEDPEHPGEGGHSGDDHHHAVESNRAFIAKMVALVLSFATLLAIAIIFIRAYKEVSLDKDDDKLVKQTAEQVIRSVSDQVSFRIPAGSRGRTIHFNEENGFEKDQSYIYNPNDNLKVTIYTSTGAFWDDGPERRRGEAIKTEDWPSAVDSRQGEIPVFPFKRAGKYNK